MNRIQMIKNIYLYINIINYLNIFLLNDFVSYIINVM